jgi:hypothetical protein
VPTFRDTRAPIVLYVQGLHESGVQRSSALSRKVAHQLSVSLYIACPTAVGFPPCAEEKLTEVTPAFDSEGAPIVQHFNICLPHMHTDHILYSMNQTIGSMDDGAACHSRFVQNLYSWHLRILLAMVLRTFIQSFGSQEPLQQSLLTNAGSHDCRSMHVLNFNLCG